MDKIIIFITTCKKYEESRAKLIENTWGNNTNIVFITDSEKCSLKNFKYIGNMNTTKPPAIIKMFNLWMSNYSTFDWFMIIDDDSYLYLDTLLDYLTYHNKNDSLMIGDFLNWTENHPSYYTYDYSKWIGGGPESFLQKNVL